jgi:hypothetical protein
MSLRQAHYLPLAPPFFFILVGLFVALLVLIQLGVLRYAYMQTLKRHPRPTITMTLFLTQGQVGSRYRGLR